MNRSTANIRAMKILVTGGGGFLGSAIVRRLLDRGDDVVIAARSDYPDIVALGAEQVRGDLADPETALRAADGVDAVVHTAAKAGIWGDYDDYYRSNVVATKNVVAACQHHRIEALVYTSTPSVTFDGTDHENATELPYAPAFKTHYAETKCEAEKFALGADDLHVVALRPHLIWGPGDPFLFPGIIERHKQGKLAQVGDGTNRVDITYVENGAVAHVRALDALVERPRELAGRAFFISDGEPIVLWPWLGAVFQALDLPPLKRKVPRGLAFAVGGLLESTHRLFGIDGEPRMTRFAAQQVTTSHWYDMTPAREAFGYEPVVPRADAWAATIKDMKARGLCG